MQMRPELQIQSMIKALADVVLPAVDPANKLAQEQARLVIGTLMLMGKQLPLQYRYDRDELVRLIEFSGALAQAAGATPTDLLTAQGVEAAKLLDRARAEPDELLQAVKALREAGGAVVSAVFAGTDAAARARVQAVVLALSAEQQVRERAWVKSQGWEPDPAAIPDIETVLAPVHN